MRLDYEDADNPYGGALVSGKMVGAPLIPSGVVRRKKPFSGDEGGGLSAEIPSSVPVGVVWAPL